MFSEPVPGIFGQFSDSSRTTCPLRQVPPIRLRYRDSFVVHPIDATSVRRLIAGRQFSRIGFQDRIGDSVSDCGESNLRQSAQPIAAHIAAPNGHNLAMNDNACHLTCDLGRVVEAWQKLSAEARLMIMALVSAAESIAIQSGK